MFLHFPTCPAWRIPGGRCTCPREWLIRKNAVPLQGAERRPWQVFHRRDDGSYLPAFRAPSWDEAMHMIRAVTAIADRSPLLRRCDRKEVTHLLNREEAQDSNHMGEAS